jgi:hypothetical protein
MTYEYLENLTNGFSEESIIGSGAYGVVYKVRLKVAFSIF